MLIVSYNGRITKELIVNKYNEEIIYVVVGINDCINDILPLTIGSIRVFPNSIAFPLWEDSNSRGSEYRTSLTNVYVKSLHCRE